MAFDSTTAEAGRFGDPSSDSQTTRAWASAMAGEKT